MELLANISSSLEDGKHHKKEENKETLKDCSNEGNSDTINEIDDNEILNRKIEYSILQQLIYRETADTLPNSRFKRIIHITKNHLKKISWGTLGVVLSFAIVFEPTWLRVNSLYILFSRGPILDLICDIIALLYLLYAVYIIIKYIIKFYGSTRLNKLNLKDGQIEIKDENSIFNRHMDEILYFFQATNYNVVIVEDLDRFDTSNIFLKLRELNFLLNASAVIGRKIKFIYAVRDDMFKDSSRTKFFDYIATVIPVINPSNAKDKLKEALGKRKHEGEICDEDLQEISFFIDDMRLLKNIANEYHQYHNRLFTNGTNLNHAKLLAMIVYKNYYPDDFSALHNKHGKVFSCICKETKRKFVAFALHVLDQRKTNLVKQKELRRRNEHLKAQELRKIYMYEYKNRCKSDLQAIKIGDSFIDFDSIWQKEEYFNKLILIKKITYQYVSYGSAYTDNTNIPFSTIQDTVDDKMTFEERLNAIQSNDADIERKKDILEREKYRISTLPLTGLFMQFNFNDCEDYQALTLEPMMELFIRRGYITEDYYDYISYFYPNTISQKDWDLSIAMKLDKRPSYDASIDKIKNFVTQLPIYTYHNDSILNIQLLDYLSQHSTQEKERFELFMARLEHPNVQTEFLARYYQEGKHISNVFRHYINWDPAESWVIIYNSKEKDILIEAWLVFCENKCIVRPQIEWIEDNYLYIATRYNCFNKEKIEVIANQCCFQKLTNTSNELLDVVINQSSYKITSHNLALLTNYLGKNRYNINEEKLSLSKIKETRNIEFIDNIMCHIETCISEIFRTDMCDENEDSIIEIVNHKKIDIEIKKHYLKTHINFISDALKVENEFKSLAFELDLVIPTWENIFIYFTVNSQSIDDVLWGFLDRHSQVLGEQKYEAGEASANLLCQSIMNSNKLSMKSYKQILNSFSCQFTFDYSFDPYRSDLEEKRIMCLIDNNRIDYTEENMEYLHRFSCALFSYFLLHYKKQFLENKKTITYNQELVINLLSSTQLTNMEKGEILSSLKASSVEVNQKLADMICEILTHVKVNIDYELLQQSISQTSNIDNAFLVAYNTIKQNLDDHTITERMLTLLPEPYCKIAEKEEPVMLPDTTLNRNLVSMLEGSGYISSFSKVKDDLKIETKLEND